MKKKLTMLLASLFLVLGTAWAGTVITDVTQLSNNKVYSIVPKDVTRGVMYATSTSTHLDACGGTANNARNPSVVINEEDSNQQFALYTHNENIYLFSVGAGKFVSAVDNKFFPFVEQPGNPVSVVASDTEGYFTIKVQGTEFVNVSTGWSYGCVGGWNSTDDGNRLQIVEVSEIPAATLQQLTEAFKEPTIEAGKMFALRENTTGLFLDIQTLGIHETGYTTNSMSLNVRPCIIYFEEGEDGKWRMRNVNGTYASNFTTGRHWNTTISSTPYDWIIDTTEGYSKIAIAKDASNYIGWDKATNITAGGALYNNAEGDNNKAERIYFTLVEYADLNRNYCVLKSPTDTYLNFTTHSTGTVLSFQSAASELYITPSAGVFYLQGKSEADKNKFVGATHSWNATTEFSLWTISEANADGLVHIVRNKKGGNPGDNLGTDEAEATVGTGIFTNVGSACLRWKIEEKIDYPTTSSSENGKYVFTSDKIWYTAPCNTLRFTLTESGASYKNGAKRLSLDSFELFDAQGKKVELKEAYFTGNYNKSYAGLLDGINAGANGAGCCCGAWDSPTEGDDYFEIALPNGVDLGGAFSFSFVTENTTMNAKAFRIDMSYEEPQEYTFNISGNGGNTVTVTHGKDELTAGATISIADFDVDAVTATEIPGYTWTVVIDDENYTVNVVYTACEVQENPASVVALVIRIGGDDTDDKFKFVLDPSINSKQETFVLGREGDKILIKGTTISAITTGLGWYLNNVAHINIAWNSLNEKTVSGAAYADLSNLPLPSQTETHASDAKYRYYLNTCTFGYSMTSWTWKRWQQEIDWMALHGINMPLQLVGLEEVWRTFLTMKDAQGNLKYGYTDEEAKAFVAGPAFIAWWAMNNLEGWGGTGTGSKSGYNNLAGAGGVQDDAWYVRQKNLAKQITDRQRELGMQPVIPGWSGMVPTNFATKSTYATRGNGGNWAGDFVRPLLLNTSIGADKYAEIAADYYECLHAVMGESQYYSMDPFHEGGGAGTMEDYAAMYEAMERATPGSQWVIQQWQWTATQRYSLDAVPAGRLVVLDLFADGSPAFDKYNGYAPQDAVFCAIPNFGGRSGLMGRLQNVTDNYFNFKAKYANIKGVGAAPEAIEQTPITYDLIFQLPWMGTKPDVAKWVENYAVARYGKDNAVTKDVWNLLRQSVLAYGADGIEGPIEDVWAARPNLIAWYVSSWGSTLSQSQKGKNVGATYTPARRQMLIDAVYKLIDQKDELALLEGSIYESNYLYDIVEFGGGVMADYAHDLLLGINAAKTAAGANFANDATYKARRDAFLQLIRDMDAFRGTNLNFRLGKWTQEARAAAAEVVNPTSATPDWYEYNNARTIVSTWSSPGTNLTDYSYRSWQGLLKDYYLPRWEYYFNEIEAGRTPTGDNYKFFEWNWAHGMEHYVGQTGISSTKLTEEQVGHTSKYTREPVGNTVDEAKKMLGNYIIPVTVNGTTHYAYRYLDNDVSNMATILANAGGTVDLTPYFGELTGISSFVSDVVDGTVTDLSKVTIKANAADGAHSANITLNDGTKLTFYFSMNPKFNGVYTINYKNGNADAAVFVGYNEDKDNANNVGYKLIATGTYSTTATGDKYFTIIPSGVGFNVSAQGKYLKAPNLGAWNHVMFSDNHGEAGVYLFEEVETELYNMRDPNNEDKIKYINDYDKLVFGNDKAGKENLATFTITKAETFPLTVTAAGMATLCLPFNVVLPQGMVAYDLVEEKIVKEDSKAYAYMQVIAEAGDVLKAGTPVIVKAYPGDYALDITMSNENAVSSLANSLLKGNFVSQTLTQGTDVKKFIFANGTQGVGFYIMDPKGTIGANKCWMEWAMPADANVRSLVIRFADTTDIENVEVAPERPAQQGIYNLAGQRLEAPQKGINIINGRKVIVK